MAGVCFGLCNLVLMGSFFLVIFIFIMKNLHDCHNERSSCSLEITDMTGWIFTASTYCLISYNSMFEEVSVITMLFTLVFCITYVIVLAEAEYQFFTSFSFFTIIYLVYLLILALYTHYNEEKPIEPTEKSETNDVESQNH